MKFLRSVLSLAILIATALPAAAVEAAFDWTQFQKIVDGKDGKKSPTSIPELLNHLPWSYRKHHTYVWKSGSQQMADTESPRVILFGEDARFVMAFNGNPAHAGYGSVDLMRWNEIQRAFELYELSFSGVPAKARISGANPQQCLLCHGNDPRPIWHPYNQWPGVYGAFDDQLPPDSIFKKFVARRASHPIYKFLNPSPGTETPEFPYYIPRNGIKNKYNGLESKGREISHMPNSRLTGTFSTLNAQRVAQRLLSSPLFAKYKTLMVMALGKCMDSIPAETRRRNAAQLLEDLKTSSDAELRDVEDFKLLLDRMAPLAEKAPGPDIHLTQADLFATAISALAGVWQSLDWDWRFKDDAVMVGPGNFFPQSSYVTGIGIFPLHVGRELVRAMPEIFTENEDRYMLIDKVVGHPVSDPTYYSRMLGVGKFHCDALAAQIRNVSSGRVSAATPEWDNSMPPVFQKCISCHAGPSEKIPVIPFGSKAAFAKLLKSRPELAGVVRKSVQKDAPESFRMPYKMPPLSDAEITEIQGLVDSMN